MIAILICILNLRISNININMNN